MVRKIWILAAIALFGMSCPAVAQYSVPAKFTERQTLLPRIYERERQTLQYMASLRPVLETYLQMTNDSGELSHGDVYALGEWDLSSVQAPTESVQSPNLTLVAGRYGDRISAFSRYYFLPNVLSRLFFIDPGYLTPSYYALYFERDEVLAGVSCAVFRFQPTAGEVPGMSEGHVWVDLKTASIIRIHGKPYPFPEKDKANPEFDAWRWLSPSGFWIPSYLYSEATVKNPSGNLTELRMRYTTMVWGWERKASDFQGSEAEATPVLQKRSSVAGQEVPEPKIVHWLAENKLIAPRGPVDDAVCAVARELIRASGEPMRGIACRTLLTSPLESFTIGQTIVVSRGLLDMAPDEPAIAAIIAHEVAHVMLGHTDPPAVDATGNIFAKGIPRELRFHTDAKQEKAARALAVKLVLQSPYAETGTRLLEFATAIEQRQPSLRNLFRPRFGGAIAPELVSLAQSIPARDAVAPGALPLGSRIELDPLTSAVSFATVYRAIPSRTVPFGVAAKSPALTASVLR